MSTAGKNDDTDMDLDEDYTKYVPPDAETTCKICMAEFIDPDDLQIHIDQVHRENTTKYALTSKYCPFCDDPYTDLMDYAIHLRDNHITNLSSCRYCTKMFMDSDSCRKHERKHMKHHKQECYSCSQCTDTFGNLHDLKNHENSEHDNNLDGISLDKHLPYLSVALKIKASTFIEYLGTNTVYICVGCDFTTNKTNTFIEHAKEQKCKVYVCSACSNTFKKKDSIGKHLIKECNVQRKLRTKFRMCMECNMNINSLQYRSHKRKCHSIKCYICEIKFDTMYQLSEHQSKEHPLSLEVKSCKYCGKQSVGTLALEKHIDRSHRGEFHLYKYQCIHCQSVYKHPQKLFGHYFTKHKDINPYTCKICNMEFRIRKKFTIHIKLKHDSKGFVEFDEQYHVFFAENKSEHPFVPKSIYTENNEELMKTPRKSDNNIMLVDGTDFNSVTETEGHVTEVEKPTKVKMTRKKSAKVRKVTSKPIFVPSSDDEPLLVVKKRVQTPKVLNRRQQLKINKKKFTCKICKKYCYTYQNFNHHITLHSKSDTKSCIICSEVFRSKNKLAEHITEKHSTSKLTETLKNLIEKRKSGVNLTVNELDMSAKFKKTIKKVEFDNINTTVKITPVENGLSVQKFIESFMPEEKSEPVIVNDVSVKLITGYTKKPSIKMTKFNAKPMPMNSRLSMPVKFKDSYTDKTTVSIKVVQAQSINYEENIETDHYEESDFLNDSIPEVAEEVLLEGTEETPKPVTAPHKIVIEKLPTEYKDMRIAHLLPQAPYYKIVKVKDVLKTDDSPKDTKSSDLIKLPDGTKLVTTNPLAHLLGNTSMEKVLEPMKNKYYKSKLTDFPGMLAQALSKLDTPTQTRKKKKIKESVDENE